MTLVELLVVVMILGLLSVVALPVLNGRSRNNRLTEAADAVSVQLSQQASRALGSRSGAAAWFEGESTGSGGGYAVVALRSGRPRSGVSGTTTVSFLAGAGTAAVVLNCSDTFLPAPIEFAGIPAVFTAKTKSMIDLTDTATNRNAANLAFPGGQADASVRMSIPYTLRLPPQRRMSASVGFLRDDTCIDLLSSTIGVHGFSTAVTSMGDATTVAIEFDRCGRPVTAWRKRVTTATPTWARTALSSNTPVAFLVGLRSQIGVEYVSSSTDDDPGVNWQNTQCKWVVVDPRTSMVRVVEVPANASTIQASQALVVKALRGM